MISFENVTKTYEDGTKAVNDITFQVKKGTLATLIGPSGCGKTTTMKMINKLIPLTSGTISINGQDITNEDGVELRRNIGYVIQRIGLLPHMTIEENVAIVPKLKGWKKTEYIKKVDELLDLVGLDPTVYKKRYPLELSGGQQQRIGVIRALAGDPPIILMDEPFSALDPISRVQLQDELKQIQKNIHKTIVFVTHDMDEALKLADDVVVMKNGIIEQIATPREIIENPQNSFVQSFIGEERTNTPEVSPLTKVEKIMGPYPNHSEKVVNYPKLTQNTTVKEAVSLILKHDADAITITGTNNEPIGMITKDHLLQILAGIEEEVE
ncbi:ABC transporter ATP-binding protein [Evansella tamaricis]|uniref:Quaternary amine transport ATP-binding protein n=1 Tax=Evansella tamaricis TaxID=2069301 RepID=A0ABS6JDU5_9BACI|nr:ABC transporter ATP-binding protein [Evansella tamaricis]MBU9711844.1 ABC transporter ATP-binding protein [Evansella tamaricis]